jgi:hypothetical protein
VPVQCRYKEPVIRFIQRHGKVAFERHRPARNAAGYAIDDCDLLQIREIHINIGPVDSS